ncbi:MAG: hypothetical protein HKN33_05425 [Pyrinomonadaceae bacterium]|nr:hypothetical protein [Pyrinomonadaceae bacterium]
MKELPTRDQFADAVGAVFRTKSSSGAELSLTLKEVTALREEVKHAEFSVVFLGPADMPEESRIYEMDSEEFGVIELHLSPFERDGAGLKLEAFFTLLN